MEEYSRQKEEIAYRIRTTVEEFGEESLKHAVICSPYQLPEEFGGVRQVHCPTLAFPILGEVRFETARFFEGTYIKDKS